MTIINRLKRHAKMAWFIRVWYKLTMFFTQVKGHKLAKYMWINQIPEALKFGDLYVPDPKALDVQYHPSKIQRWLDNGKPRHFDCDDHAIYWCTVIKKYNLARKVYIGFVYMVGADNKSMGHAVCVYEGWDGVVAWGDYGYPTPVKDVWEFANVAEDRYKAKKVSAVLVEIRKVKGDCTPMYGKSSYKIYD